MELTFIDVEGNYGGDQHWLPAYRMQRGGCSTVTAAEICASLAARNPKLRSLYPGNPFCISKQDFIDFAVKLFDYIYPRERGLTKLPLYIEGFEQYAREAGVQLCFATIDGDASCDSAGSFLTGAIDAGCYVACLLLEHADDELDDITWHWFTLTGYACVDGELTATFATYGQKRTVSFRRLWETGRDAKGGLIRIGPA